MKREKSHKNHFWNKFLRAFGIGDPPSGYWIETNGYMWRWVKGGYTSIRRFATRAGALIAAWETFEEQEIEAKWQRK